MLYVNHSFSQNTKIDSLLTLLKTDKPDTTQVIHLYQLCDEYRKTGDYEKGLQYGNAALVLAKKNDFKKGIAYSYNNIGIIYANQGNYPEALKNYFASLKIREEIGDKKGIASSYNNIGGIYYYQGNYLEALKNYFASLKIREELGDKKGIASSYNNIGMIYNNQGNSPEVHPVERDSLLNRALKNYFASLSIEEELGDKNGIAMSYNNIGIIYHNQGNYPEVHPVERDSLLNRALKNYFASLKIKEEIGDKNGIAMSYINLGSLYIETGKLEEAKDYLTRGLALSKEIGSKDLIKDSYSGLSRLYSATGNYGSAYQHYKLSMVYNDSLFSEEKSETMGKLEARHEFAIIEMEMERKEKEEEEAAAEAIKRRDNIQFTGLAGILLVVVLIVLLLFFSKFNIAPGIKTGSLFIALILLFEFMLVWFDPSIENFTGGNPAYKLFLNALLALGFYVVQQFTKKIIPARQLTASKPSQRISSFFLCIVFLSFFIFIRVVPQLCAFAHSPDTSSIARNEPKDTKLDSLKLLLSQYEIQSDSLHSQNKMKEAFETIKKYGTIKDSLQKLEQSQEEAKVKERQSMEIQQQIQKQEAEEKAKIDKEKKERKDLLIYSMILIGIIFLFIGFSVTGRLRKGKFAVPQRVLEGGLFVSFLLFFEFILVFADPYIDQYTGGAPAWKFGFNLVLAGLIFPVHGWLEEKMRGRVFREKRGVVE